MKTLVGPFLLLLSFASVASSGETKTFIYNGSQKSVELLLSGEKTHTEYRSEQQASTCYRTDIVGHRTICSSGGNYNGGYYPGRGYSYPGRSCQQQPIYQQVAYTCVQTIQVPYEVSDFFVDAKVILDVSKFAGNLTPDEKFIVKLHGDNLSVQAIGSKKFFIMLKKEDIRTSMNGSVKYIDGHYGIGLIEAAPVLKTLKFTDMSLENSTLQFGLGPIANRTNIGLSLEVVEKKVFKNITLFDRELDTSEVTVNTNIENSSAEVELQGLGVNFVRGNYRLTAKAFFKATGTLMNQSQFGNLLSVSKDLRHKVK